MTLLVLPALAMSAQAADPVPWPQSSAHKTATELIVPRSARFRELQQIQVKLVFKAGSAHDPQG